MNIHKKVDDYTAEKWVELYKAGYSTRQIAKYFHRGQRMIWRHLSKVMKLRLSLWDGPKYPKRPFSGDLIEKAYLLGFRYTDISACRHRKQIQAWLSTTHPAMLNLFADLFSKYSIVKCYPIKKGENQGYEWTIYCYLNRSFEFLDATKNFPSWILKNDVVFLSFFAGCVDGDGSISIERRRHELWYPVIRLCSQNKSMLHRIFQKLKEMGYHPTINVTQNKGSVTYRKYRLNNDLWTLCLHKRSEIIHLLKYLPLKHAEKVEKQKIILENADGSWTKVADIFYRLRENIRKDVSECIAKAQREHDLKFSLTQKQTIQLCRV